MPLLSPSQIHEVLKPVIPAGQPQSKTLKNLLDHSGLSQVEIAENIATIMRLGDSDNVKLQAAKLGAQMQEMLDTDESTRQMSVTIVIRDNENIDINPILIPR